MLNKENLLCVSSNAPEPGYVPAKLTIGHYQEGGFFKWDWYGYRKGRAGSLTPNSVNGKEVTYLEVAHHVLTETPFYFNGVKYQNNDEPEPLLSLWKPLVGQTVDIWLSGGGVKTLILRAIAALSGGLRDAWKGNASWRNWPFSVCARGNRRSSGPNGKSLLLRSTISSLRRNRRTLLADIRRIVGKIPLGSQLPLRSAEQQFDHRLRLQNRVCLWTNKPTIKGRTLGCPSDIHSDISNATFFGEVA